MPINRVTPNITTNRLDESRAFYCDLLGFEVVMDMDWIITLAAPGNPTAQISLLKGEPTAAANENITLTIEVDNPDGVYGQAIALGHPITYPLTNEPWGVRRFHMQDPNGVTINVMTHNNA